MTARNQYSTRPVTRPTQQGMTLIELMVAMLIGLFLLIGTLTVFSQSRSTQRTSESVARLQENARFALDNIEPDLRLAKFWGRSSQPRSVIVPPGMNVTCDTDGSNVTLFTLGNNTIASPGIWQPVVIVDESDGYAGAIPCPPRDTAQAESDVIVVRHASGQVANPTNNVIQAHLDIFAGRLFSNGAVPPGYGPNAQTHNVMVNVYYVDTTSDLDENLPSLRVKTLTPGVGGNGILQDQELIPGVENLQVQVGVDTNGDGAVERYVDGDHPLITPGAAGFVAGAEIIAMRLWMLMRHSAIENGFTDDNQYLSPDIDINPVTPGNANYPDSSRRLQVSKTILLRNARAAAP